MKKRSKMGKKELKSFKDLLIKKKINLLREMNHLTSGTLKKSQRETSGDLSGYSYHMADMASDVYERDFLLQLAEGEREFLFKIDDALKRIEEGNTAGVSGAKRKYQKSALRPYRIPPTAVFARKKRRKSKAGANE